MYVASKQRYGEDLDSFEHATEKQKGLNMHWKTLLCKSAKYALSSKAKKSEQPMNPRKVGVLECKNPIYDQNGKKINTLIMIKRFKTTPFEPAHTKWYVFKITVYLQVCLAVARLV